MACTDTLPACTRYVAFHSSVHVYLILSCSYVHSTPCFLLLNWTGLAEIVRVNSSIHFVNLLISIWPSLAAVLDSTAPQRLRLGERSPGADDSEAGPSESTFDGLSLYSKTPKRLRAHCLGADDSSEPGPSESMPQMTRSWKKLKKAREWTLGILKAELPMHYATVVWAKARYRAVSLSTLPYPKARDAKLQQAEVAYKLACTSTPAPDSELESSSEGPELTHLISLVGTIV
jgi:hypothetical protein